uniref:Dipeptidase n=1 Tax=Amphora coffeiformis TaxID=265554 RepID=A0A7S3P606_9STRA
MALIGRQHQRSDNNNNNSDGPKSCDTFVALPPATPAGVCIFGKNSDRPTGEGQSIRRYPAVDYSVNDDDEPPPMLECTYMSIPQVSHTHAVLLSQIDWMWGCEMGANEHGVVIGNEAVWTVEADLDDYDEPALLGMDLVRLGLERGGTAREALDVVTTLLETYGQGRACAENDPSFTYHNSFLIADPTPQAFVLETAGRHWVAEHITKGTRNISNGLTIRTKFDLHSAGLHEYAQERKLWNGKGALDWAATFSEGGAAALTGASPHSRQSRGCALLQPQSVRGEVFERNHNNNKPWITAERMMDILKDHKGGICMHGPGFETTASMVSELHTTDSSNNSQSKTRHWMTGRSLPCQSPFLEQSIHASSDAN